MSNVTQKSNVPVNPKDFDWPEELFKVLCNSMIAEEYEELMDYRSSINSQSVCQNLHDWSVLLNHLTIQDAMTYIEADLIDIDNCFKCMYDTPEKTYIIQLTGLAVYGIMKSNGFTDTQSCSGSVCHTIFNNVMTKQEASVMSIPVTLRYIQDQVNQYK
jgi:hypothetical protein